MSFFDVTSGVKVQEIFPMTNQTAATTLNPRGGLCSGGTSTGNEVTKTACDAASGTWTPENFLYSLDVRAYMGGIFILTADEVGANCTLTVTMQKAVEPGFESYADLNKRDTETVAAFTDITAANDNQIYYCKVDFSQAQNSVGIKAVTVNSSGTNRARWGLTAVLFPIDTSNDSTPQFEI